MPATATFFAIATILYILCGLYTWQADPRAAINRAFAALCLALGITAGTSVPVYATHNLSICLFWDHQSWLGWCFYPPLVISFFIYLTGKGNYRLVRFRHYFPYLIAVIFFTRSQIGAIDIGHFTRTSTGTFLPNYSYSAWGIAYHLYEKSAVLVGLILLIQWGITVKTHRQRRQALLIGISSLVAIAIDALVYIAGANGNLDIIGAMAMCVVAVGFAYAITKYQFIVPPHTRATSYLLAHMRDLVVVVDLQGTVLQANAASRNIIGWEATELIGQPFNVLQPNAVEPFSFSTATSSTFREVTFISRTGEHVPVELTSTEFLDTFHDVIGTLYIARDLRHVKQLEHEISVRMAAEDALRMANTGLAKAAKAKDEFLASMSHELRTPLTSVIGLSEALRLGICGDLLEKQLQAISTIEESGQHLLHLINEILDLSKIEAGKMRLQFSPTDIREICQASLRLVEQSAQRKLLRFSSAIDDAVQIIYADPNRLKQILVNLLSNAVKFTPEGGAFGLHVTSDQTNSTIHFTVWDTGIGIPDEHINEIFSPFTQLDSRLSRQYSGTGLGLSLVQRMVEQHEGCVAVTSEVGKGSEFTVTIPWRTPSVQAITHNRYKPSELPEWTRPAHFEESPPCVLLVEDNPETRELISEFLTLRGYRILTAENGERAVTMALNHRPDLILMDIQMPNLDGLEATRLIRAKTAGIHIYIIALTALVMPNDRERCLAAGVDEYISKPVSLALLDKLLAQFLNQRDPIN